jgi:hypothetical protein
VTLEAALLRIARLEAALKTLAFQGYEIPRQIANKALEQENT